MKKPTFYSINLYVFFMCFVSQAQTFFTEDFNSYPVGHLNTVYDNSTPGHGGWLISRGSTSSATGVITAEAGKGNVLTVTTSNTTSTDGYSFKQEDGFLRTLWNNRTPGNDIFKFEYEFYGVDQIDFGARILSSITENTLVISTGFQSISGSNYQRIRAGYSENASAGTKAIILKNYNTTPFPHNTWIKVEMFVDYNANNVYFYLPTLNIQVTAPFYHNIMPFTLDFAVVALKTTSILKFDNIKVSGLKTLPSYILSINEQLATRFNLYPNPVTNVVNITNNENMLVEQVTIYDSTGKQLSTQSFNNEPEIQLNVESLPSGVYQLYLQTNEGIAVKKLVKK